MKHLERKHTKGYTQCWILIMIFTLANFIIENEEINGTLGKKLPRSFAYAAMMVIMHENDAFRN